MAKKKIFPLAVLAVAVGAFAYAMRSAPVDAPAPEPEPVQEQQQSEQDATNKPDASGETAALPEEAEKPPEATPPDDEQKLQLPSERAEQERLEAAKKAEEPPPEPKEKRLFRVTVEDAGTILSGEERIKLAGVDAREPTDRCTARDGRAWPCGAVARAALMRLIRGRAVNCEMPPAEGAERGASCKVSGTDLTRWVLENGWAEPAETASKELKQAHAKAKEDGLGLYRRSAPQIGLSP